MADAVPDPEAHRSARLLLELPPTTPCRSFTVFSYPDSVGMYQTRASQYLRQVLLRGVRVDVPVGVLVPGTIPKLAHQPGGCVPKVQRHPFGWVLLGGVRGKSKRFVHPVRLRGGRQVDGCFRQRELALRRAKKVIGLFGGQRHLQRPRVSKAHVLRCDAHEAARDVQGILASRQHPCQPVQRSLHVAPADGLVQRRNEVEVLLAALVGPR